MCRLSGACFITYSKMAGKTKSLSVSVFMAWRTLKKKWLNGLLKKLNESVVFLETRFLLRLKRWLIIVPVLSSGVWEVPNTRLVITIRVLTVCSSWLLAIWAFQVVEQTFSVDMITYRVLLIWVFWQIPYLVIMV